MYIDWYWKEFNMHPLVGSMKRGREFRWINFLKKHFSQNIFVEKRRFRAEGNARRAALLDGQITSGNWQNISWKITRASVFRGVSLPRFGLDTMFICKWNIVPVKSARWIASDLRGYSTYMYRVCVHDCTHARVIKTYLHNGFFIPVLIKKGGEPFLVLRLILSGGWFH